MRTSSRAVAVLLFDEVEILDVAAPLQALTMAGRSWNYRPFKIVAVASRAGLIETRNQLRIEARHSFAECPAPELVVVPGGYGARRALDDPTTVEWVARAGASAAHTLGVGNGVLLLAKAGLLEGRHVSISRDAVALLAELAPTAHADTDAAFRESGNVITARTPGGALDAILRVVAKLVGKKQANEVAAALGAAGPVIDAGVAIVDSTD